ncbi:MAG: heavy metal translocating P-type ATPase [Alphaproteobacteria bacterium]
MSLVAEPRTEPRCAHCGEALPAGAGRFCCAGCAAARALVDGLGLDRFYDRFVADAALKPLRPDADARTGAAEFARHRDGVQELHLMVDGLHCAACVWLIEEVLGRDPRVVRARVNMTTRRLVVAWRGAAAMADDVLGPVAALGFGLAPFDPVRLGDADAAEERRLLRALAVAGFAAANVMLLSVAVWAGHATGMGGFTRDAMHWLSAAIALPAIAYAGRPYFAGAARALAAGRASMDVPIAIGVTLAAAMSLHETIAGGPWAYFDSAITLLFFLLIGRYLDHRARGRAREAAAHLLALRARSASVVADDGSIERMPADRVPVGARVLAAAGESIAVDGIVVTGRSDIDTALVTGESVPRPAAQGTAVFAGTLNLSAPLTLRVTAAGEGTLLSEIVRLMEAAEHGRSRVVVLADRVARRYAPVVHLLALATFLAWWLIAAAPWQAALLNAIAVLIVTCPCALGLAVPAVQVVASGRLMRRGVLLKSAAALERLAAADTLVLDKTGTLTLGRPVLQGRPQRADLEAAAGLAAASRHPLSQALMAALERPVVAATGVVEHPGQGLAWAGPDGEWRLGSRAFCGWEGPRDDEGMELVFVRPGRRPVRFAFADALRPDAAETVARIGRMGLDVVLLSGDRAATVARAAREAGIARWQAATDPAGKIALLGELARAGHRVVMVGDGLNDAPALAAASVSISPAGGADIAQAAADVVFQGEALAPVAEAIAVARAAAGRVRENLTLAVAYNLLAVPLAALGQLTPLLAAIAMSSSSLLVIANSLRLREGTKR